MDLLNLTAIRRFYPHWYDSIDLLDPGSIASKMIQQIPAVLDGAA